MKFIRVHGRVIPIREDSAKNRAGEGAVAVGGVATTKSASARAFKHTQIAKEFRGDAAAYRFIGGAHEGKIGIKLKTQGVEYAAKAAQHIGKARTALKISRLGSVASGIALIGLATGSTRKKKD